MNEKGRKYLFSSDDHSFHFKALRVLQYAPYKAADVNEVILWMIDSRFRGVGNALIRQGMKGNTKANWAINQGMWVIGAKDPASLFDAMASYTSKHVLDEVTCDVLLLEGENDHFLRLICVLAINNGI